jgi:hypothetical protein
MRAYNGGDLNMNKLFRLSFRLSLSCIALAAALAYGQENAAVSDGESTRASASDGVPESEIAFNGLGSFGHFHIFANTWYSYLDFASVEYDRHSWGRAAGARMDYTAEVQPMVLLWQPSKTDAWGNRDSKGHEFVYGVGVMPIGLRMMWRDKKNFKPYFTAKGGVLGFDKKALSSYSSYMDFSLEMGVGAQFRIAPRWDARAGFAFYHFSNGFIVPSNPGLDSMMYSCGLVYHLHNSR